MPRNLEITTPLGADAFMVTRLTGREEIGRLSEYQLDLLSPRNSISDKDILGKNVTIRLAMGGGNWRYFNGYVSRFMILGETRSPVFEKSRAYAYQMTVRPWLWFLSRTSTCQIFLEKDVPTVIKEVFGRWPFAKHEQKLSATYQKWENCVQYRETDFNFVSRLMEQEGIYYFFEHDNGKHEMVMLDAMTAHKPRKGYEEIEYNESPEGQIRDRQYIHGWEVTLEIQPGRYAIDDYDFEKPQAELAKDSDITRSHDLADLEIFDFPGEYVEPGEGSHYAKVRIEELQSQYELIQASSNCRGIETGRLFKLAKHPLPAQNRDYLILSHHFQSSETAPASGKGGETVFQCSFTAIPKANAFRPQRVTPKPIVQGPQTAVVVGPKGEEIHTDKYGRVKVQFHWDRYAKGDENSSCWMRVSQPWAGKNWGMTAIPRIGQEVVVEFLEGDPDWPIITGRVHNAEQMPPYALPANATRTGIVTHSSKGGGKDNFNELRFEDKKGAEQVFLHAEKDLEFRTKNDRVEWVGNESHLIVAKDTLEKLDADYHLTLKGDHNEKLGGSLSFKVGQDTHVKAGQKVALDAGQEIHLKAGMKVVIEAGTQVSLKVGGSFVNISPAGVDISGPLVKINSGGSAGSGSGASPIAPKAPKEADKGQGGEKGEPPKAPQPPKPNTFSPQATAFQTAAAEGNATVPIHTQEKSNSCVIASSRNMIQAITGTDVSEATLRSEMNEIINEPNHDWERQGTDPSNAAALLKKHGVDTEQKYGASKDDLAALTSTGKPVLVGFKNPGHRVMLQSVSTDASGKKTFTVADPDPAFGGQPRQMTEAQFDQKWNSNAVVIVPK
ncbi:MAG: type VI secretion system tip protein VgrG [Thiobacillaceae bacterium]|jgi:type VI secretion system secreted protein VgrG|nr:type VI secretion system tip protein VgrG [Thiobacillaceae bacterium]